MIESIRLTESEKEILSKIKRKTGIASWNVLCRWAYLLGLSQDRTSSSAFGGKRDAIEIRWETFVGGNSNIYTAITQLKYSEELHNDKRLSLFDFVHGRLSTGIRVLSKSAAKDDLRCFSRTLDLSR
jgi:DNA sulfur modification protein DndE